MKKLDLQSQTHSRTHARTCTLEHLLHPYAVHLHDINTFNYFSNYLKVNDLMRLRTWEPKEVDNVERDVKKNQIYTHVIDTPFDAELMMTTIFTFHSTNCYCNQVSSKLIRKNAISKWELQTTNDYELGQGIHRTNMSARQVVY